jgi:hypothetical protein
VGQRVQGDRRVAGAARPAAQCHLLGHRARGEESGGLRAEQPGDLGLQGLDHAVAVDVRQLVEVVQVVHVVQQCQALPERVKETGASEHALRAPVRADAPLSAALDPLFRGFLVGYLLDLFRRIAHGLDHAWLRVSAAPGFPPAFPYVDGVRLPTACGQPNAPRTDRVNMTRNRPVPGADWNGKAAVA